MISLRRTYVLGILLFSFLGYSQNVILNSSFERCNLCPTKLGSFKDDVIHWSAPTLGSTDYFNSCSPLMGTPENFNGKQLAQDGSAYAGFYLYAPDDYREYMQTKLTRKLEKGREYRLTLYVSRAEGSDFAIQEIGVLLVDREMNVNTKKTLTRRHWYSTGISDYNHKVVKSKEFWEQTSQWVKVETTIEAKGMEEFLIIGNFKPNKQTRISQTTRGAKKGAYYYIDNLQLVPTSADIAENQLEEPIALNKSHRFQNVLFEFDRYLLLDTAKTDIQRIYTYLEGNADLKIHIDGHTDDVGSANYNRKLSNNRCEAVADYLMKLGLPKNRISWSAHGGTNPIADNTTDEGRRLNRRVEFILVKSETSINK